MRAPACCVRTPFCRRDRRGRLDVNLWVPFACCYGKWSRHAYICGDWARNDLHRSRVLSPGPCYSCTDAKDRFSHVTVAVARLSYSLARYPGESILVGVESGVSVLHEPLLSGRLYCAVWVSCASFRQLNLIHATPEIILSARHERKRDMSLIELRLTDPLESFAASCLYHLISAMVNLFKTPPDKRRASSTGDLTSLQWCDLLPNGKSRLSADEARPEGATRSGIKRFLSDDPVAPAKLEEGFRRLSRSMVVYSAAPSDDVDVSLYSKFEFLHFCHSAKQKSAPILVIFPSFFAATAIKEVISLLHQQVSFTSWSISAVALNNIINA
ncbi:unnamed protein product [Protopolystoma xenopodis]|uniref:Uncharacterized protein n=1 Tax=Protopolystoma xenopodis TaxID=117903 RepID=A0A448WYQ6_9PLAT|nr:unnamed protein product [Protopolystoma xenopodis]